MACSYFLPAFFSFLPSDSFYLPYTLLPLFLSFILHSFSRFPGFSLSIKNIQYPQIYIIFHIPLLVPRVWSTDGPVFQLGVAPEPLSQSKSSSFVSCEYVQTPSSKVQSPDKTKRAVKYYACAIYDVV